MYRSSNNSQIKVPFFSHTTVFVLLAKKALSGASSVVCEFCMPLNTLLFVTWQLFGTPQFCPIRVRGMMLSEDGSECLESGVSHKM